MIIPFADLGKEWHKHSSRTYFLAFINDDASRLVEVSIRMANKLVPSHTGDREEVKKLLDLFCNAAVFLLGHSSP